MPMSILGQVIWYEELRKRRTGLGCLAASNVILRVKMGAAGGAQWVTYAPLCLLL